MATAGETIKQARENLGLSQEQLAARLGVAVSTIGHYERDQRHASGTLKRIGAALGVSLFTLLGEPGNGDPEIELVDQQIIALLKGHPLEVHVKALAMLRLVVEQS